MENLMGQGADGKPHPLPSFGRTSTTVRASAILLNTGAYVGATAWTVPEGVEKVSIVATYTGGPPGVGRFFASSGPWRRSPRTTRPGTRPSRPPGRTPHRSCLSPHRRRSKTRWTTRSTTTPSATLTTRTEGPGEL